MQPTAVRCDSITVQFGQVRALDDVSLAFPVGQIHALLGQNGAGKSTMAGVLSGILKPARGSIEICGRKIQSGQSAAARSAGLDIVHQRFSLPPSFRVAEALEFAAARKMGGSIYSLRRIERRWQERLDAVGIAIDLRSRLASLPVETRQSIEILRALANDARVLILDEPTALLSPTAVDNLFRQLRELRDQGVTPIVILHKLKEVLAVADTVAILRQGQLVLPPTPKDVLTTSTISTLMVGAVPAPTRPITPAKEIPFADLCRLDGIATRSRGAEPGLQDINLILGQGEILGIAGIEGNGQRALAGTIAGLEAPLAGRLTLAGSDVTEQGTAARRVMGFRAVPFDRMTEGLSLTSPLWENVQSWAAERFRTGPWPLISIARMQESTRAILDRFGVSYRTTAQRGDTLSGGNMQRVILGRELAGTLKVLLAAQPTRGLDFAATRFVWQELHRVRDTGAGIILISSDLDELFGISDRILVMRGGRVVGTFTPPYSARAVGSAMVGAGG